MSKFSEDNNWQRAIRDAILSPFYKKTAFDGRFVYCDKGSLADILQREMAIDTIYQGAGNRIIGIEEKIVRWPGKKYTAFTLETMSCTTPGRERKGWMHYAKCDVLLYCFEQADSTLEAYAIPFQRLKDWFFQNETRFNITVTKQINATECRIVPIQDVLNNIPGVKMYKIT